MTRKDGQRPLGSYPKGEIPTGRGKVSRRKIPEKVHITRHCSFCGLPDTKVKKLIAAPAAMICDQCVVFSFWSILEPDERGDNALFETAGYRRKKR